VGLQLVGSYSGIFACASSILSVMTMVSLANPTGDVLRVDETARAHAARDSVLGELAWPGSTERSVQSVDVLHGIDTGLASTTCGAIRGV